MRIEHCELTFLNLPMAQPELWAWGRYLAMQGHPDYLADDYVVPVLDYADGLIGVDDGAPGLGLAIDEAKVGTFAGAYERDGMSSAYTKSRAGGIVTVPSQ
jgi:hypothetical protein